jgi:uncharacterized protein with PIN domain
LNEPAADDVERELRNASRTAWISAIDLAEVVDVMERIYRCSPAATLEALMLLESGGLRVAHVNGDIGVEAGAMHARHHDRKKSALSMADCIALGTARSGRTACDSRPGALGRRRRVRCHDRAAARHQRTKASVMARPVPT